MRFSSVICEIEIKKCIGLGNEVQYRGQVNCVNSTYVQVGVVLVGANAGVQNDVCTNWFIGTHLATIEN